MTIWDPTVVARLSALELHARTLVTGFRTGAHRSRRVSSNIEFADYKPYTPGDPLRDLDWRIAARSDRLVVRRHHAEEELAVTIVVDASADMGTGRSGRYPVMGLDGSKWSTAAVLAATLAQWMSLRGDPVGLRVLAGEDVRWDWLPPGGGPGQLGRIHRVLAEARPGGKAELGPALMSLGPRIRRNSLVVILSDLMEPADSWGPALDALGERRCDVRVVQIFDREEWTLRPASDSADLPGISSSPSAADALSTPSSVQRLRRAIDHFLAAKTVSERVQAFRRGWAVGSGAPGWAGGNGGRSPLDAGLFFSPEGGAALDIDPEEVARGLQDAIEDHLLEVRGWLSRCRGLHVLAPSSDDLSHVVAQLLGGA